MWKIVENRRLVKHSSKFPLEVRKRYEKWKQTVATLGPQGLAAIPGFHDEALQGEWHGYRASRLGLKWRVIYQVCADILMIHVVEVNAHDYKKH